jgi:hypothetical protein
MPDAIQEKLTYMALSQNSLPKKSGKQSACPLVRSLH